MIRNQAGQEVSAQILNASTGAPFVGTVLCYVKVDAGALTLGTTAAGVCTSDGHGEYTYRPSADETNGANCRFTFEGTGGINQTINFPTTTAAQASALQTATGSVSTPVSTIISDALAEIRIIGASGVPTPEDANFALGKLNRLFDNWNAERPAVYVEEFNDYALTPSLQPHTIGPNTATITVTQRPVSIEGANLVVGSGVNAVRYPVNIRDENWWLRQTVQGITTTYASDLYYEPTWPNGSIFLWPVMSGAARLELMTRLVLGQVVAADVFWMPPGYRDAVTLTLAEELWPAFGEAGQLNPQTIRSAQRARDRVFSNNTKSPKIATRDSGLGSGRTTMNYLTREVR